MQLLYLDLTRFRRHLRRLPTIRKRAILQNKATLALRRNIVVMLLPTRCLHNLTVRLLDSGSDYFFHMGRFECSVERGMPSAETPVRGPQVSTHMLYKTTVASAHLPHSAI